MPWRSGSPQAVFSIAAEAFTEAAGASFATVTSVGLKNTSTETITSDAPTDFRSRLRISHLLLTARQRTYSRQHPRSKTVNRRHYRQGPDHCPPDRDGPGCGYCEVRDPFAVREKGLGPHLCLPKRSRDGPDITQFR